MLASDIYDKPLHFGWLIKVKNLAYSERLDPVSDFSFSTVKRRMKDDSTVDGSIERSKIAHYVCG